MRKLLKTEEMKTSLNKAVLSLLVGASIVACTDLKVEELDSKVIESSTGEFTGVDPAATLSGAYLDLRQYTTQDHIYALLEVTGDQQFVPTRGTDWGDNGVWRVLHTHDWDANHQFVLSSWNFINGYLFKLNQMLDAASNPTTAQQAEGSFLRAFHSFYILDLYGQMPVRGVNDGPLVDPTVLQASEIIDQMIGDLDFAISNLPDLGPADNNIKGSKASARFLKAKLLLNKHIYLNTTASPTDMSEVVTLVDQINASGYDIEDDYFRIFAKHDDNTETILYTDQEVSFYIWNGLHYAQGTPGNTGGGWNGFSTTKSNYELFEGPTSNAPGGNQDERRGYVPDSLGIGFLVGLQYAPDGSGPLTNRQGGPLNFTADLPGLLGNGEVEGIRMLKYHPTYPPYNEANGSAGGPFKRGAVLYRYADAHLMKIEAILRGGTSSDDPTTLLNELRTLRNASNKTATLDEILDERGRELYKEGWRRNDQIRFGTFTQPWEFKTNTESFRVKFPIPSVAVSSNPNLKQNEGY